MTDQEWRRRLKAAHLCKNCKREDAYTLHGRTYCAECAGKHADYNRKLWADPATRERQKAWNRAYAARNAARGLCITCGRPAAPGRKRCPRCLAKDRAYRERRRAMLP